MATIATAVATIPLFKVRMDPAVDAALLETLHSGFIGQGPRVDEFEKELQSWVGRKTILATNSCTSAIHLALRLANVRFGDEVISTPVTCTATNEPIAAVGGRIVWADVDRRTGLIDPNDVIHKITARTKAIVAVHWGGRACDLDALRQIADEHDLKLIEDAAHALGGTFRGEPVGSHGDFVAFSFQAIKHVTTGDGGLLSCKSPADYERGKLLRWYGIKRPQDLKQDIPEWGYKFHMNDLAATIGIENLKGLQKDLEARRRNAEIYASRLQETVDMESAFWFYPTHREDREKFIQKLSDKGIASGVVHERNDTYSMFKSSAKILPGVDAFCATQVNLPVGPWVELSDIERALA